MRDLPIFTTEYGVASLTLRDVPYLGTAYIKIQSTLEPQKFLEECISFCTAVGAERIYASGVKILEQYPFHTAIYRMQCRRETVGDTDAALWPVQENSSAEFRRIYNEKVRKLPNAAWMDSTEENKMLRSSEGYFVHRDGSVIGIGRVSRESLRFLAAIQPGAGRDVVRALSNAIIGDTIDLEVASTNEKALRLYRNLGFIITNEISKWYCIK